MLNLWDQAVIFTLNMLFLDALIADADAQVVLSMSKLKRLLFSIYFGANLSLRPDSAIIVKDFKHQSTII